MFLPFYDSIEKQEFRKHIGTDFLIPETAIRVYQRQIIPFQFIVKGGFGVVTKIELISINTLGIEQGTQELPTSYVTSTDAGGGDWLLQCSGDVLSEDNQIKFSLFYIRITAGNLIQNSEVLCKVKEVPPKGRIILNTGAVLLNNKGGAFILNNYEDGLIVEPPIRINYSRVENFGKYNLEGFNGFFYFNGEIVWERDFEVNQSEDFDGVRFDFEQTTSSIFSTEFLASRGMVDLLRMLYFFDIEIIDQYGTTYTPEEPVTVVKEREAGTGFYVVKIEFKINNTLDL